MSGQSYLTELLSFNVNISVLAVTLFTIEPTSNRWCVFIHVIAVFSHHQLIAP